MFSDCKKLAKIDDISCWKTPNLERFNSFNEEHPLNIPLISVTLSVLKLERFISFNDEHPENI